jgi:predicted transcriptional regulator
MKHIRKQRTRLGISSAKLAGAAGIRKATLLSIELGRSVPKPGTVDKINQGFKTLQSCS